MAQPREDFELTLTQDVLNVLNAAHGATLSGDEIVAIAAGEAFAPPVALCIGEIAYKGDGEKIFFVQFDSGTLISSTDVTNLSDFREQFRDAANHGHAVRFIVNTAQKRIDYLTVVPCECPCDRSDAEVGPTFETIRGGLSVQPG